MDCWRNWNNVVDLSSFMLLESTGDSEGDYFDQNMVDSLSGDDNMEAATCDIDYAQSCCSDSCDIDQDFYNDHHHDQEYVQFSKKMFKKIEGVDHAQCDYNPRYNYEEDDDDNDEDEGVIDQDLSNGQNGFVFSKKKRSNLYVNCTMEPMNEEEKNKLFWETCLAS